MAGQQEVGGFGTGGVTAFEEDCFRAQEVKLVGLARLGALIERNGFIENTTLGPAQSAQSREEEPGHG